MKKRGFTLLELMVTIAIVAIAMSVAVPSMLEFQRRAALTTATNTLTSALNVARSEAMKRSMMAFVVPFGGTDWNTGYRVFVDRDRSSTYDDTKDVTVTTQQASLGAIDGNLELTGSGSAAGTTPAFIFDATGYLRNSAFGFASAAITITRRDTKGTADEPRQTRNVMVAQTGRVRTCTPFPASEATTNCNAASP